MHTWTVGGTITAAPGTYPVPYGGGAEAGASASTSFDIHVAAEDDIEIGYEGDEITFLPAKNTPRRCCCGRQSRRPTASIGDVRKATITFMEGSTVSRPASRLRSRTGTRATDRLVHRRHGWGFHDLDIVVGGYYTGTEDQVVEVAKPDDTHITAVGETVMSASARASTRRPTARRWAASA